MTENTNPKPFNISRQQMLGRTAILGLSINQSINQSTDPFTVKWLNRIQIKDYQKCKRFVYRL